MTKYIEKERARYWPISPELMSQYCDGSHDRKSFDGVLYWHQNDKVHRDGDKPAVIHPDSELEWRQNGPKHRNGDKPAWIGADGSLIWYQNGDWHRICGPATICSDGELEWGVNGEDITQAVKDWLAGEEWCGTPEQIVEFQFRFC